MMARALLVRPLALCPITFRRSLHQQHYNDMKSQIMFRRQFLPCRRAAVIGLRSTTVAKHPEVFATDSGFEDDQYYFMPGKTMNGIYKFLLLQEKELLKYRAELEKERREKISYPSGAPIPVYWYPDANKPAVRATLTSREFLEEKKSVAELEIFIKSYVSQQDNNLSEVCYSLTDPPSLGDRGPRFRLVETISFEHCNFVIQSAACWFVLPKEIKGKRRKAKEKKGDNLLSMPS